MYRAGIRCENHYFSEVDKYAQGVYKRNFPEAVALGDITKIDGKSLPKGEWLLTGGFPCQDISLAGKRAGLAGSRSGLWFEYARLIGELRPRFAIVENVAALAFRGLDRVLGSLAEIGYDAVWQNIRACDVGAPHIRERIWIVAYTNSKELENPFKHQNQTRRARHTNSGFAISNTYSTKAARQSKHSGEIYAGPETKRFNDSCKRWWSVEPNVGRVADGVPFRLDRLKCVGQALVPQIIELLFMAPCFDRYRR